MHTYMHTYIQNYILAHTHTHTHARTIHTYIHTYVHTRPCTPSTPIHFTRVLRIYLDSEFCEWRLGWGLPKGFSWPPPYFFLWGHFEAEEDLLVRTVAMSAQYTVRRCNACSELRTALVHNLEIITFKILRAK